MGKKVTSPLDLKPGRSLLIEHPAHGPVCIGVIKDADTTIISGGEWATLVTLSPHYFEQYHYVIISQCEDCWSVDDASRSPELSNTPRRVGDIVRGH